MVGVGGGAAFIIKCFKLLHRVPAVDRTSIELLAMLERINVLFLCCFVW